MMHDLRHWIMLCEATRFTSPPIKPASEDVFDVIDANFGGYGRNIGPRMMPIDRLKGGVSASPEEAARVARLKAAISSENGYISRLIVDTEDNVIEGQHRLEALRQLGIRDVPVYVIEDLAAHLDIPAFMAAIAGAQPMHADNRTQVARMALDAVADEGSPAAARAEYDPPTGFEAGWHAALDFLEHQ